jgi:hypothetical protein
LLPGAIRFSFILGFVDGKCGCGKACGRDACKHPHPLAPQGHHSATNIEAAIRSWFRKHPELNYGISTDTLPTADIDPRHDGDKSWRALIHENYDVVGWRVRTGSGGEHIMFGTTTETLPSKIGLAKGVDFKGVGGYIVGVGSMHISGKRYIWDRSAMPNGNSPEAPPPWLVKLVLAGKTKPKKERTPEEDEEFYRLILSPAQPGERRKRLSALAGHVFGTPYPNRGVLMQLMINHTLHITPDLTDFPETEMVALLDDLIERDDFRRGK